MENFPLIFEQFFKRLLVYILILAAAVIGIPVIVILSQPQNFQNAISSLTHSHYFEQTANGSPNSVSSVNTKKSKHLQAPAHLLSMGWLTGTNNQLASYQDLQVVSPLFATIGDNNHVQLDTSASSIANLHAENKKVWGRVTLSTQSDTSVQQFLNNASGMDQTINSLIANAKLTQLDGINLDIEQIPSTDFVVFSQFIEKFSKATKQAQLTLSIDLQPESAITPNIGYFDQQLGTYADYLIFMGYDQHWSTDSTPGPVTSLQWLEDNIKQFIQMGIPPQKLVLGLPTYSRIWKVDQNGYTISSAALSNEYVNNLMQQEHNKETWDPALGDYYTTYNKYGNTYEVWLSNNRSLEEYLNLISKYNLGGVGFWSLDMLSSNDWNQLMNQFNLSHKSHI